MRFFTVLMGVTVLGTGCSSFEAPRPGESELIRWIEFTHDVCEAIKESEHGEAV